MNPKYIRVASDLHLEAFSNKPDQLEAHWLPPDERDSESILALAGDISSRPDQLLDFLKQVESRFMKVYVVPGNHEYYRHNFDDLNKEFESYNALLKNTVLSAGEIKVDELDNCHITFGTLWADGGNSLQDQAMVGHYLNDFRLITKGFRLFTVTDMFTINAIHKNQIVNSLTAAPKDKTKIVITHHLPSYTLCHPRFGTDCNGGFASHCDKFLHEDWSPDLWIYGHTHDTQESRVKSTLLICNPAGYRGEWGSSFNNFHPKFIQIA